MTATKACARSIRDHSCLKKTVYISGLSLAQRTSAWYTSALSIGIAKHFRSHIHVRDHSCSIKGGREVPCGRMAVMISRINGSYGMHDTDYIVCFQVALELVRRTNDRPTTSTTSTSPNTRETSRGKNNVMDD